MDSGNGNAAGGSYFGDRSGEVDILTNPGHPDAGELTAVKVHNWNDDHEDQKDRRIVMQISAPRVASAMLAFTAYAANAHPIDASIPRRNAQRADPAA